MTVVAWRQSGTYKSSASRSIAGCRPCPVQTAHDEENYAGRRLACVDNGAATKLIDAPSPEHDSKEVATAGNQRSANDIPLEQVISYLRITEPRNGSSRPARAKKSALD